MSAPGKPIQMSEQQLLLAQELVQFAPMTLTPLANNYVPAPVQKMTAIELRRAAEFATESLHRGIYVMYLHEYQMFFFQPATSSPLVLDNFIVHPAKRRSAT